MSEAENSMFKEQIAGHAKRFIYAKAKNIFDIIDFGKQKMIIVAGLNTFVLSFSRQNDGLVRGVQFYITPKKDALFVFNFENTTVELVAEEGLIVSEEPLREFLRKIIEEEAWL